MIITAVELEDIKSYEKAQFSFSQGVIAISGPNGAGKTTILEAIAWVLFDHLPYKKEDYLRRGAKKGIARVTFRSHLDDREYTVHRDTSNGYYIFDPVTKIRLVEQKQQVLLWIKTHLGIDAAVDLKTLFLSTIGVPQGMLTTEFAEPPAKRKVTFDKVLRVDEYQLAADELRGVGKHIDTQKGDLREGIARLEVEAARLEEVKAEFHSLLQSEQERELRLRASAAEFEQVQAEVKRLSQLASDIQEKSGEMATLASRLTELKGREEKARDDAEQSLRARAIVEQSRLGFENYNHALLNLKSLEANAVHRDQIAGQIVTSERELAAIRTKLTYERERQRELEGSRTEIERLEPLIIEQESFENQRQSLQTMVGEFKQLSEQSGRVEKQLGEFRDNYKALVAQIEEVKSLEWAPLQVMKLESQCRELQDNINDMKLKMQVYQEHQKQSRITREKIGKLDGEIKTLQGECAAVAHQQELAAQLPQLELQNQRQIEEIATLKMTIEREETVAAGIEQGLCPLLSQPCRNMKEGEGLDQYFTVQIGDHRKRLQQVEKQRAVTQRSLRSAVDAQKALLKLESLRHQLARYEQDREIEQANLSRLESELATLLVTDEGLRRAVTKLKDAEKELDASRQAKSRYEQLELLQKHLERVKAEGSERRQLFDQLKEQLAQLHEVPTRLEEVSQRLQLLNDPRGRVQYLRIGLQKSDEVAQALERLNEQEVGLTTQLDDLRKEILQYASLDQLLQAERDRRAKYETDYQLFVQNTLLSQMLEERQREWQSLQGQTKSVAESRVRLQSHLNELRTSYNEPFHRSQEQLCSRLVETVATERAELAVIRQRKAGLEAEVVKLEGCLSELHRLNDQKHRYEELEGFSEYTRDVLKKAVPFVTEAHLFAISQEANLLYREITGNDYTSLQWNSGYEIIIEESGYDRPFQNLSGGEQMAAALSVRLSLLKELSEIRLAFFDEPTTNLDEDRRRNLAEQIGRIKDFHQLFVISHDDTFENYTDQVVQIGKGEPTTSPNRIG